MEDKKMVGFTIDSFKRFKKAYNAAVKDSKEAFVFDGNEFATGYAKYVIEYLEPKLGGIK